MFLYFYDCFRHCITLFKRNGFVATLAMAKVVFVFWVAKANEIVLGSYWGREGDRGKERGTFIFSLLSLYHTQGYLVVFAGYYFSWAAAAVMFIRVWFDSLLSVYIRLFDPFVFYIFFIIVQNVKLFKLVVIIF